MNCCPACHGNRCVPFHTIESTPVTCTSIFDTPEEARAVPSGRVELTVCEDCGFVFNRSFDAARAELGAIYESSQAASAHFSRFASDLAGQWVERHRLAGRRVLEVGCGHGDFMRLLLQHGVAEVEGIDPLVPAGLHGSMSGLHARATRFDDAATMLAADALVCRHTLEHIDDVRGFLERIGRWAAGAAGRVVLFELPDAQRVLAEGAFWDIYYEHCSYFTEATLREAFERAGMEVMRQELAFGGQYLLLEARAASARAAPAARETAEGVCRLARHFGEVVARATSHCDDELVSMSRDGRPIVVWQGAAKTVGFLASLAEAGRIRLAVDLSPQRHGRFLPGSGLPVHAPEHLLLVNPGHVILMNPVYADEVERQLREMGLHEARLRTIDDLLPAPLGA